MIVITVLPCLHLSYRAFSRADGELKQASDQRMRRVPYHVRHRADVSHTSDHDAQSKRKHAAIPCCHLQQIARWHVRSDGAVVALHDEDCTPRAS